MKTERLRTQRTVRLISSTSSDEEVKVVWLCCHGYGMDVERFAKWFEVLPKGHKVYCPEGLSRFYWGSFTGKPVASWMTKLERLPEIDDFIAWLDKVYSTLRTRHDQAKIVLLGFSQGAATILRWVNARRPPFDKLILWSGTPPEDISYEPSPYYSANNLHALWGTKDELVAWERAQVRFDEVSLDFQFHFFEGGHRIDHDVLLEITTKLFPVNQ